MCRFVCAHAVTVVLISWTDARAVTAGGPVAATNARAASPLGVGFLWTARSESVAGRLGSDRDFVDVILGPGKMGVFESVKAPVRVSCIARSLERDESRPFPGVRETIALLEQARVPPERVIIAYNPESQPGTPSAELDELVDSSRKAKEMARAYGASLLVGPGLREMERREHLYPELAKACDIWMIQSQRLQLDEATRKPVEVAVYREQVSRIAGRLREGNPGVRIIVQLVTTAERGTATLPADQIVAFARSIEDIVDAVRIYGAPPDLLQAVISGLRAPGSVPPRAGGATPPPAKVPPASPPAPQPPPPASPRARETPVAPAEPAPGGRVTLAIPMRDGSTLAADLFLPEGREKDRPPGGVPAVLICTPYDRTREGPARYWRECLVRNGYAFVAEDMRGFHASAEGGRAVPRHNDGYDTVEWLARQPWCNGRVGMLGYSHLGAVQYETAVTAPPHLACAIPAQAPGNYYADAWYPERFRKADMETILRGAFTSQTPQLLSRRIRSRETRCIGEFRTPMLHSAGWFDFYKEGAIEMFRACQRDGGPGARGTQKLLIGPWGHGTLQEESPGTPLRLDGGLAFPANSKLDWEKDVWLPWFDHWLKGRETGVMGQPAVRYYLMGAVGDPEAPGNRWVVAEDFPPPSVAVSYYAHPDRSLGTLVPDRAGDPIRYVYNPRNPVPTVGRVHARMPVKGPYDQREVETRPDVILFTTPPLTEPLEIVGQVRVRLWASSDRRDTDFTAKLTDVYPDGRSILFLDGIVKGRHRNTYLREEFLSPGEICEFDIDMGCIALVLAKGHRLRLAVSSSNFDRFDINPNTGEPYGDHAVSRELLATRLRGYEPRGEPQYRTVLTATNRIHTGREHPTRVILPVTSGGPPNSTRAAAP
jgi:hypothetical protein